MRLALAGTLLALVAAAPAWATRAPTTTERKAIVEAVRFFPTVGRQNTLIFTAVGVSSTAPAWGYAIARVTGNGTIAALVRRTKGWQVVALGKRPLACTRAPAAVRREFGSVCRAR